jgi:hypothetical protein
LIEVFLVDDSWIYCFGGGALIDITHGQDAAWRSALGRGLPNHRVLDPGWQVELLFGADEVPVPVKSLVDGSAIDTQVIEI